MNLTLDMTWKECLRMWKWIAEHYNEEAYYSSSETSISLLKRTWLERNGYNPEKITNWCFFCHHVETEDTSCKYCPAKLVDKDFKCNDIEYCWYSHPEKFYQKLVELDTKRSKK